MHGPETGRKQINKNLRNNKTTCKQMKQMFKTKITHTHNDSFAQIEVPCTSRAHTQQ